MQERDVAMMVFLTEQKFASREQLARRFFVSGTGSSAGGDRVCYRRILKLMKCGLLEARTARLGGKVVYQVARGGITELARRCGSPMPYLGRVDGRHFEHDLYVTDVRIAVEALGAQPWISERRLRATRFTGHVPDALFRLGENYVALELELVQKRRDRYEQMFRATAKHHADINVVWYLCATRAIAAAVLERAKVVGDPNRYYVSRWSDFCARGRQTLLESHRERFELAELG